MQGTVPGTVDLRLTDAYRTPDECFEGLPGFPWAPPEVIDNASHFLQEDAGVKIDARIVGWLSEEGA